MGEFLPNGGTYVDLDPDNQDDQGMALPRLHVALGDEEYKRLKIMAKTTREILKAAGVTKRFEEVSSWDIFNASHVFGTCRMGDDGGEAVVDAWGRSFRYKNLYIADASLFPSSGGGASHP